MLSCLCGYVTPVSPRDCGEGPEPLSVDILIRVHVQISFRNFVISILYYAIYLQSASRRQLENDLSASKKSLRFCLGI